jgi:preprotein translocase subunit SecG
LILASIAVFAVGIVILLLLDPARSAGRSTNGDTTAVLGGGMAVISYVVQRAAFLAWRRKNLAVRTGSWLAAVGTAAIFSVVTLGVAVPIMLVAILAASLGGYGTGAV